MKKISTLITVALFTSSLFGQLKLVEPSDLNTDVNGQTLELIDVPSATDMEIDLFVINTSSNSLTMVCTRTEVDGLAGTQNSTCWQICPEILNTGAKPSYTVNVGGTNLTETAAPGDTIHSFAGHYYPSGLDGCSLFKYEWSDATTGTVYATVYVRFVHLTSGVCTASVDGVEKASLKLFPNPSNDVSTLEVSGVTGEVTYEISNLLGQVGMKGKKFISSTGQIRVETASLTNGVYFVSIKKDGKTLITEKLVVRH